MMQKFERKIYHEKFLKTSSKFEPPEINGYQNYLRLLHSNKTKSRSKELGLKLICISDTHGCLFFDKNQLTSLLDKIPNYDLCILLGDIHLKDMEVIITHIPKEKIIGVVGNHDSYSLYDSFGVKDISGKTFKYKGITLAGIEGCYHNKDGIYPSFTQYESLWLSHKLPKADILISHDRALDDFQRDTAHVGLIGITYYIYTNKAKWHLHGHIHDSYSREYENGVKEKSVYLCEYLEI